MPNGNRRRRSAFLGREIERERELLAAPPTDIESALPTEAAQRQRPPGLGEVLRAVARGLLIEAPRQAARGVGAAGRFLGETAQIPTTRAGVQEALREGFRRLPAGIEAGLRLPAGEGGLAATASILAGAGAGAQEARLRQEREEERRFQGIMARRFLERVTPASIDEQGRPLDEAGKVIEGAEELNLPERNLVGFFRPREGAFERFLISEERRKIRETQRQKELADKLERDKKAADKAEAERKAKIERERAKERRRVDVGVRVESRKAVRRSLEDLEETKRLKDEAGVKVTEKEAREIVEQNNKLIRLGAKDRTPLKVISRKFGRFGLGRTFDVQSLIRLSPSERSRFSLLSGRVERKEQLLPAEKDELKSLSLRSKIR